MALVTKTFSDIITFTRASTGTYFNSSGTLVTAAINGFRLDYNPSTLAAQGLLIEEQRTNQILQSQDFSTTWTLGTGNPTITTNAIVAPDGTLTADKLVEGTSNGGQNVLQINVSFASGTNAYSVFAKAGERYKITLNESTTLGAAVLFDLSAGTVLSSTGGGSPAPSGQIQAVGNGWYRCTMLLTQGSTANRTARIYVVDDATTTAANSILSRTGDGTSGVFIWGAQLEAGAFPTSYIPTTTAAVTRSADAAIVNTLTPWYNQTEGTLYAELGVVNLSTSTQPIAFSINDTTANNRWSGGQSTGNLGVMLRNTGGVGLVQTSTANAVSAGINKLAVAISSGASIVLNGGTVATSATYSAPTVTQLEIGRQLTAAYWNGYIRRITYYPRRLSNAELQTITA